MDPALIFTALSKLIAAGMAAHKSVTSPEGFDEDDLDALKTALDSGSWLAGLWPRTSQPSIGAKHLALISHAFGAALGRYWVSSYVLSPDDIRRCLQQAGLERSDPAALPQGPEALHLVRALSQDPMRSPYYKALWDAFSNPVRLPADAGDIRLLGEDPREFERHFRLAYYEAMASHGQDIRQWLIDLDTRESPEILRHILAQDMAGWGNHGVFGNERPRGPGQHDVIPFLPLDRIYVEPRARHDAREQPVETLVRELLQSHPIVVVSADFGHGKSLTARRLARDLAAEWLRSDKPGPAAPYPVFITAARDMRDRDYNHGTVVRRALWNHGTDALGTSHSMGDSMFAPLKSDQAAVFVLDGLDEIAFSANQLEILFQNLNETMGSDQRAVIFTRPAALHNRLCLPNDAPLVVLQGFSAGQIEGWIRRWNDICAAVVQSERLQALGLDELAATPILLFMIALTWAKHGEAAHSVDKTAIYESFFRQIARGRYEAEPEHPIIARAARALRESELIDGDAQPVDAMLWLMSRVAWQAHIHAYATPPEPLQTSRIARLLQDELAIEVTDVRALIQMGLLLAMQIDPTSRQSTILFGHQSFREFLVARYWNDRLCALVHDSTSRDKRADIEQQLMKAHLLQHEDQAFSLLIEMLRGLDAGIQLQIRDWARECVNSRSIRLDHRDMDLHPILRASALAIGSDIDPEQELQINEWALRYLCFWHMFHDQQPRILFHGQQPWIRAPGLKSPRSRLSGADLREADLRGADLREADLGRADLRGADLSGANLSGANLSETVLIRTNLSDADLSKASLSEANLSEATLIGANLTWTTLSGANLSRANLSKVTLNETYMRGVTLSKAILSETNLGRADLSKADLSGADLSGFDLRSAKLGRADLRGADLRGANLTWANLSEADLSSANLSEAALHQANLSGANLSRADLSGANLIRANLIRANLVRANLVRALLMVATLRGANLSRALVNRESLAQALEWENAHGLDSIQEPPD